MFVYTIFVIGRQDPVTIKADDQFFDPPSQSLVITKGGMTYAAFRAEAISGWVKLEVDPK